MKSRLTKKDRGFTIIEVMIVLAVAALILAIIFLAVPALQRNSRNTQRRNDVAHYNGLINEWIANHSGTTLTKEQDTTSAAGPDLTNENFAIVNKPANNTAVNVATAATTTWFTGASATLDTFYVWSNATCTNTTTPAYSSSSHSYATVYYIEPGTTLQCIAD